MKVQCFFRVFRNTAPAQTQHEGCGVDLFSIVGSQDIIQIIDYLSFKDINRISRVSTLFRQYARKALAWNNVFIDQQLTRKAIRKMTAAFLHSGRFSCVANMEIDNRSVTNKDIKKILEHVPNLRTMSVRVKDMHHDTVQALITKCPLVHEVHMTDVRTTDRAVQLLSEASNVKSVSFENICGLTQSGFAYALKSGVQELVCRDIPDFDVKLIAPFCESFWSLDLSSSLISDEQLCEMVALCKNVKTLAVAGCPNITDKSLRQLVASGPKLSSLNISKVRGVDASLLAELLKIMPELQRLQVSGMQTLFPMSAVRHNLERLDVSFSNVTDTDVAAILSNFPCLIELDLRGCAGVTRFAANAVTPLILY